jgi:hypothetical protein
MSAIPVKHNSGKSFCYFRMGCYTGGAGPERQLVVRSNRRVRRAQTRLAPSFPHPPRDLADKQPHDENCLCEDCEGRRYWPQGYVGSLGRSFDCIDIHRWSWGPELTRWGEDRAGKDGKRPTKREALAAGLFEHTSERGKKNAIQVMRQGCEGTEDDGSACRNPKRTGQRYCTDCEKKVRKQMIEAGYLPDFRSLKKKQG